MNYLYNLSVFNITLLFIITISYYGVCYEEKMHPRP